MTDMSVYLRAPELCGPGHLACQGCGATLAMRHVLKALGERTIIAIPACCWAVIAGPFPYCNLGVPVYHCAFETAAATAAGIRAGLDMQGIEDVTVMAWAGDGGTLDIGLQALSAVAERNEDILYVCYDNEAYMNTGIQRSSATPYGAWTTTTPEASPKAVRKKDIDRIMAAHRIPYLATACVSYPEDLIQKCVKAKGIRGTKFIHILAPCPPGWRTHSDTTITIGQMAVESNVFPLYEVEDGERYRFTYHPKRPVSVEDYLRAQGRFRHLTPEMVALFTAEIQERWDRLHRDCAAT